MKFVMSYSCGKDSTLALHKMIQQGHEPVCLLIMVNEDVGRSYFHGADASMMERYSKALGIPAILCPAKGETYHLSFEEGLQKAKGMGVEAACFGDIDIQQNRQWEEERCQAAGLAPVFPLWQRSREENVYELLELGYRCLIKSINTTLLPREILGKYMDASTISVMRSANIDICGENGEYHTLMEDGPIFKKPMGLKVGEVIEFGEYAVADIF